MRSHVHNKKRRKPRAPKRPQFNKRNLFHDTDDIKCEWQSLQLPPSRDLLQSKRIIFIAPEFTDSAMKNKPFEESFETAENLFYHLQHQCKLQIVDRKCKLFKSCRTNQQLIVFNAELKATKTQLPLYIVGRDNIHKDAVKIQWEMIEFMTAPEIKQQFHLHSKDLPLESRLRIYDIMRVKDYHYKEYINWYKDTLDMRAVKDLFRVKQIKPQQKTKPLVVGRSLFIECIRKSIECNELQYMIWFNKNTRKPMFSVQILLPIEINQNWFGIAFDKDSNDQWRAVQMCIDDVDVRNKLRFFRPSKDIQWFSNNISDLRIVDDDVQEQLSEKKEEAEGLRQELAESQRTNAAAAEMVNNFTSFAYNQHVVLMEKEEEIRQLRLENAQLRQVSHYLTQRINRF